MNLFIFSQVTHTVYLENVLHQITIAQNLKPWLAIKLNKSKNNCRQHIKFPSNYNLQLCTLILLSYLCLLYKGCIFLSISISFNLPLFRTEKRNKHKKETYFNTVWSGNRSWCSFQNLPLFNPGKRDTMSSGKRGVPGFSDAAFTYHCTKRFIVKILNKITTTVLRFNIWYF